MNLCSNDHEEVCYEGRSCPACEAIKDGEKECDALANTIDDLKDQIEELRGE